MGHGDGHASASRHVDRGTLALALGLILGFMTFEVAVGVLAQSLALLSDAAHMLTDAGAIGRAMAAQPGVNEVHDLHLWELTSGFPAMSAHVLVGGQDDCHAARRDLERELADRLGIEHTTLQVDHTGGELLSIEHPEQRERRREG